MQKNLYFRDVAARKNHLKNFVYDFFFIISSLPKLLLEVFIRKNFGERYFSYATSVILFTILFFFPILELIFNFMFTVFSQFSSNPMNGFGTGHGGAGAAITFILRHYLTWYVFIGFFLYQARQRRKEIKSQPSVFDFARYSKSTGIMQPGFRRFLFVKNLDNPRKIECFYEPLPFFILGFVLIFISQYVGWLLLFCSIVYAISYRAAYHSADNWIMDKIDEIIVNEEMEKVFLDDEDPEQARGFRFMPNKPKKDDLRRKAMETFYEDDNGDVR